MASDTTKAADIAKKIEARAQAVAAGVAREIRANCGDNPAFWAIILHAVERKIAAMREEAERVSGSTRGRRT